MASGQSSLFLLFYPQCSQDKPGYAVDAAALEWEIMTEVEAA